MQVPLLARTCWPTFYLYISTYIFSYNVNILYLKTSCPLCIHLWKYSDNKLCQGILKFIWQDTIQGQPGNPYSLRLLATRVTTTALLLSILTTTPYLSAFVLKAADVGSARSVVKSSEVTFNDPCTGMITKQTKTKMWMLFFFFTLPALTFGARCCNAVM